MKSCHVCTVIAGIYLRDFLIACAVFHEWLLYLQALRILLSHADGAASDALIEIGRLSHISY